MSSTLQNVKVSCSRCSCCFNVKYNDSFFLCGALKQRLCHWCPIWRHECASQNLYNLDTLHIIFPSMCKTIIFAVVMMDMTLSKSSNFWGRFKSPFEHHWIQLQKNSIKDTVCTSWLPLCVVTARLSGIDSKCDKRPVNTILCQMLTHAQLSTHTYYKILPLTHMLNLNFIIVFQLYPSKRRLLSLYICQF